jgi:NAD+ kinase
LSGTDRAYVTPKGDNRNLILTQDGQLCYELLPDDHLEAMLDPDIHINIIQLKNRSYYDLLREKLRWGFNGITDGGD